MNNTIYVTGHTNPDTDSIASAMAYANLLRLQGHNAVACRLGPLNEESKFVTKYFDIEGPLLINDARTQLRDIEIDAPIIIKHTATVKDAWNAILQSTNQRLVVVDDEEKLCGIVSKTNLTTARLLDAHGAANLLAHASIDNIAKTVDGIIVNESSTTTNGHVYIISNEDEIMATHHIENSICIVTNNIDLQKFTIEKGINCLILARNNPAYNDVITYAQEKGCSIISSTFDTMKIAKVINESFPINTIMTKKLITFYDNEYIDDVEKKMRNTRFGSYPIINDNGNVIGQISRYHIQNYAPKKFVLVDHSSIEQSIRHIDQAEILAIIDHHHIGTIKTNYPVDYRNQKCGSTATIITTIYQENGFLPDETYSGVLLSAIISDTLNFKSKTTTSFDIFTAKWLAERAKVNINEYAIELLNASADIKDMDLQVILKRDLKTYKFDDYHIAVGQTNFKNIEDIQLIINEFREHMQTELEKHDYDLIIMMFTQVDSSGTLFEYAGRLSYIM